MPRRGLFAQRSGTLICPPNYTANTADSGGCMTDQVRPRNDAHAVHTLSDGAFLAYALVQAMKLLSALIRKRWPEIA